MRNANDRTRPDGPRRDRPRRTARASRQSSNSHFRPTAVWRFHDADLFPGTDLPGWFGRAIVSLVARYTQPGERVLLNTVGGSSLDSDRDVAPYVKLADMRWAIVRLGRRVRVVELAANPVEHVESEVRPELNDGFALAITAVSGMRSHRLRGVSWSRLLTVGGRLAVISSGQPVAGGRAPVTAITSTVRDNGLAWLEHIAVENQSGDSSAAGRVCGPFHVRTVHHDVLVFGCTRGEASDECA
ncbi:hypothetical protein BCF44_126107 [Kutzneria buriramensis]|uniref:Uncharacterized protein n=1 Tax=Kutzneria buriramensis TaxID=1045776 RepID=A0A3E0GX15_9PSEU|nr:hypothetical protein BCF44_126107 [Kutzneria buriramensis]